MAVDQHADIHLVGFSMWVDGYQFPDSINWWDANWLRVRVVCIGQQAIARLADSCVHSSELAAWLDACVKFKTGEVDKAELASMEPYLRVAIDRSGELDGLVATVKLTPDNFTQFHEFRYQTDPTYLPGLIASLQAVLNRFPVRGKR